MLVSVFRRPVLLVSFAMALFAATGLHGATVSFDWQSVCSNVDESQMIFHAPPQYGQGPFRELNSMTATVSDFSMEFDSVRSWLGDPSRITLAATGGEGGIVLELSDFDNPGPYPPPAGSVATQTFTPGANSDPRVVWLLDGQPAVGGVLLNIEINTDTSYNSSGSGMMQMTQALSEEGQTALNDMMELTGGTGIFDITLDSFPWEGDATGDPANFGSTGRANFNGEGLGQDTPIMPTGDNDTWRFDDVSGLGRWFDPPMASGYLFETQDGSKFTQVGLPTGIEGDAGDELYTITDDLGQSVVIEGGSTFDFPTPASSFTISGIDPTVDGGDANAFPTFLLFDSETVNFTQTPIAVPEPSTMALCSLLILLGMVGTRRARGR